MGKLLDGWLIGKDKLFVFLLLVFFSLLKFFMPLYQGNFLAKTDPFFYRHIAVYGPVNNFFGFFAKVLFGFFGDAGLFWCPVFFWDCCCDIVLFFLARVCF